MIALDEKKGGVAAKVQGSSRRPYKVTIGLDPLTDAQWDLVVETLADQAVFTAQLLAGEMPPDIEEAFAAAGVSLFPETARQLHTTCSCPDYANPCKHVAAVHYILGEQFDEDPFLLFRLRGRSQEALLADLRARRAAEGEADFEAEADDEPVAPLSERLDDFWGDLAWENWRKTIEQALPPKEYPIRDIPLSHDIFHIVFDVKEVPQVPSIQYWYSSRNGTTSERGAATREPHLRGIWDNNGRLMVIMSHNTDLADGWEQERENEEYFREFSVQKSYPLGINIVVYALTH